MPKKFIDLEGLETYHNNVVDALNRKSNKTHMGYAEPTEDYINVWLCLNDSEYTTASVEPASLDDEELIFNEEEEVLTFNNTSSNEELTFNEEPEELIFNPESE